MNAIRGVGSLVLILWAAATASAQGSGSPHPWEEAAAEVGSRAESAANDVGGAVDEAMGPLGRAHEIASNLADGVQTAREGYDALSDLDRQLDRALDQPDVDAPPVPASCLTREGCEACYSQAYLQLARSRVLLLRARALFDATHRFASAAQAVGDTLAPSTREAAFVWQMQKPRIAASLGAFDSTFDRKINDMLAVVRRALQDISECEARHYNNPDWYARYGFVYFEFLQSRHRRS